MIIDVLTLFPDMFAGVFNQSILKKLRRRMLFRLTLLIFEIIQQTSISRSMIIRTVAVPAWY